MEDAGKRDLKVELITRSMFLDVDRECLSIGFCL